MQKDTIFEYIQTFTIHPLKSIPYVVSGRIANIRRHKAALNRLHLFTSKQPTNRPSHPSPPTTKPVSVHDKQVEGIHGSYAVDKVQVVPHGILPPTITHIVKRFLGNPSSHQQVFTPWYSYISIRPSDTC